MKFRFLDVERPHHVLPALVLGFSGGFVSVYSILEGLVEQDIFVPVRHSGTFHVTGADGVLAGWIYLMIGFACLGAGIAAWLRSR